MYTIPSVSCRCELNMQRKTQRRRQQKKPQLNAWFIQKLFWFSATAFASAFLCYAVVECETMWRFPLFHIFRLNSNSINVKCHCLHFCMCVAVHMVRFWAHEQTIIIASAHWKKAKPCQRRTIKNKKKIRWNLWFGLPRLCALSLQWQNCSAHTHVHD